jgi:hypothetical protein
MTYAIAPARPLHPECGFGMSHSAYLTLPEVRKTRAFGVRALVKTKHPWSVRFESSRSQDCAMLGCPLSELPSNFLLSPPGAWRHATQTRIGLREVALIGKAAGACNFGKRKSTVAQ